MYEDKKSRPLHLVLNTGTPTPVVSRWMPPPLDRRIKAHPADAYRRNLTELSVDLVILARRAKQILKTLDQAGSLQEQSLYQLTERLEHELIELLSLNRTLQNK